MTLEKRLAALAAALDAREQDAALTTEQLDAQVAVLVAFLNSDRFDMEKDVISQPHGPHTGPGCERCTANRDQTRTVDFTTIIEQARSAKTDHVPISENEWRARGRWWPDNADITCLAPTFALLALED